LYARKHGVRLLHTLCLDALWMLQVSYSGRARKKIKGEKMLQVSYSGRACAQLA
jgi:hypothetical protein